ncbi:MAG: DEAD/DEAH box helicase [Phycisphaerales bacterium]|nr:DEAD/DEAH box helicase [Phycisphaerales bacterium]
MQLQAIWFDKCLYLWGQKPAEVAAHNALSAGSEDLRHCVLLDAEHLSAALGEICSDTLVVAAATTTQLSLRLPADEQGPVVALDGAAAPAETLSVAALAPFTVAALRFDPTQAIDLLAGIDDQAHGRCAPSLHYWKNLAQFVVDRLAIGQFHPDLIQPRQGEYHGQWRLGAMSSQEAMALEQYAAALPPVCQCIDGAAPAQVAPAYLVETFLHTTTDQLIRRDVAVDEFFNRAHVKAAEALAPAEVRWLSALLGKQTHLRGSHDELMTFAEQVRSWIGQLDEARADEALRLSFELVEPEDEDDLAGAAIALGDDDAADDLAAPADDTIGADHDGTIHPTARMDQANSAADQAEEHRAANQTWYLRLILEPAPGEEGESIAAADLWGEAATGILGRTLAGRRQRLTRELARAAEIYPVLKQTVALSQPAQAELSTLEAHVFIRQWAQMLSEHGFGVHLPDWTQRRDREIGLLMTLRPGDDDLSLFDEGHGRTSRGNGRADGVVSGELGLEHLLNFDWQVAVGDLRLSVDEFRTLALRHQPLVKYKGQWIHLEPDAAERALDYIAERKSGKISLAEAFRSAYGLARGDTGLPILGLSGLDWVDHLLSQTPGQLEALEQPSSFQGELRPYQKRGLQWLAFLDRLGIGACLADDMGLGKTPQLISLMLLERQQLADRSNGHSTIPPTLLFAPTSVVGNWVRELGRFAPQLKVMVHHGPQRLQDKDFADMVSQHDVVVTSYALAHRDAQTLAGAVWWRVALDEAQKIKNPSAASTQAIRAIAAPRRVALTGTPIENHLSELWSIMELLNPGLLGSASEFRERFAVPIEKLGDSDRAGQLRKLIQPFVLRRSKTDPAVASDLPEKMEQKIYCNLTAEQAAAYERITADMLNQIDAAAGIRRRGLILAALTRLKQICNHPILLTREQTNNIDNRSGKCERLAEMLEEVIGVGDAALIFTQYREMGHLLQSLINTRLKSESIFLHGGTPAKTRNDMIDRFQSGDADAPKIFILSLRAGGLGLNLTAANHVFHFDRWWNPAVESQATDRAYRIGQKRKVQVHKFVCVGTVEERIDKLLAEKIALADKIVSGGDEWLTNLSTEELRSYLQLTSDAIGDF